MRRIGFLIYLCVLLALFYKPIFAQDTFPGYGRPQAGMAFPTTREESSQNITIPDYKWNPLFPMDEYELGPGDILNINFSGAKDSSQRVYVSQNSQIFIGGVDVLNVKGLKLKELLPLLRKSLKNRISNTSISVALVKPRDFMVKLSGAVKINGEYPASQLTRLSDFLMSYGGLGLSSGIIDIEIENIKTKSKKIVNYQNFLMLGDESGNPFLKEGDTVFIPFKKHEAIIKGNINRPGIFQFAQDQISLSSVIEGFMGGFSSDSHWSGDVTISRLTSKGRENLRYPQREFFDKNSKVNYFNFELKNGDHLFFPLESIQNATEDGTVYMTGQVKLPGAQPFRPGTPLASYISAAGGITDRANYDKTVVYKVSGTTVPIGENVVIEPGDTVFVPEITFKFWQDHLLILTTLLGVVTTTIAITR